MKEQIMEKFELLLNDLKEMQELEQETKKQFFTTQLFAIRVKEIYKLVKQYLEGEENEKN
jgi:hypothetical protein